MFLHCELIRSREYARAPEANERFPLAGTVQIYFTRTALHAPLVSLHSAIYLQSELSSRDTQLWRPSLSDVKGTRENFESRC